MTYKNIQNTCKTTDMNISTDVLPKSNAICLIQIKCVMDKSHIYFAVTSLNFSCFFYLPLLYAACRRREVYTYLIYMTIA